MYKYMYKAASLWLTLILFVAAVAKILCDHNLMSMVDRLAKWFKKNYYI